MEKSEKYPKILIVALGKINYSDAYNNGLFLRNLIGSDWPRENLAQIYSSGNNNDRGFFDEYYCLGPNDRILGKLFYKIKSGEYTNTNKNVSLEKDHTKLYNKIFNIAKQKIASILIDTGLYEIIFRPKLSKELMEWAIRYKPDIVLAQGYNLTFTWLPLMLKNKLNAKLAVLTTDDWPKYQYAGMHGEKKCLKWLIRPFIKRSSTALFKKADFTFAFGLPMAEEYQKRYGKKFIVLNHSDDPERFKKSIPHRELEKEITTIVAIGTFNKHRYPLILDLNNACERLNANGNNVRCIIYSSAIDSEGRKKIELAKFIGMHPDPGNDELPSRLKGADILLLIEGFDEEFVSAIELSISSKAHLFMFSQRPIIVYSSEGTGVAKYAKKLGWATVVLERNSFALEKAIIDVINNKEKSEKIIEVATNVATINHTHNSNRSAFRSTILENS
ncbi:hypothetical protein [Malikia spinosa]|uniref:hypothetical protein n=1 Tax=Malikia spinosa TaxID=86180 RepID=UPI003FA1ACAF